MVPNPHARPSSFGSGQPGQVPQYPIDKPVSEIGAEGLKIVQEAREATRKLQVVRDAQQDAVSRYRAARAAYEAEVRRGGETGEPDLDREHELSLELSACERAADPQTHQLRQHAAIGAQRAAATAASVWLYDNLIAVLDEELREEAESASAELIEAYASIQHSVDRYNAIRQRVFELMQITVAGEHAQEWARILQLDAEPLPPLPSDEGIAIFERARQPDPEPSFEGRSGEDDESEPMLRSMPEPEEPILTRANVLFGS